MVFIQDFYYKNTSNLIYSKYFKLVCNYSNGFLSSTDEFDSVNETGDLEPNDWTPETGFDPETKAKTYPRPAAGPGSHMGLKVILNAMLDEYFCSSTSSVGFKVR